MNGSKNARRTVRATAPLRISFVGGGTDFPHWYGSNGGAVLSSTIDHHVEVTVQPRDDRQVRIRSMDLRHLVEYRLDEGPAYDGVMDLPKAAIERMGVRSGLDVDVRSDAPPGSGLGGSSALVTAVVAALAALEERQLSPTQVAELSFAIEREDLGIAGGRQDQYAAAFGGFNLLEFAPGPVKVTPVRTVDETLVRLQARLLLCYTGGVRTDLGLIETQIRLHREGREETMAGMKQLQAMAYEMRDAIERGDVDEIGPMLRQAYEAKRRMNPHIADGTQIQRLLDAASDAGADGGKICGAGGGGYLLVSCRPERQREARAALEALGGQIAPFAFDPRGVEAVIAVRRWTPARG